ncbi:tetratricopeptide repeat-containing protein [Cardiosporidium cionae]|uniref:Tetratricopeptide repeat-containing protein n=1 Tax=Cardiosporidium cionae TaxID=476202 RepID=A0ABQ7JCA8_9APIC|nr:tetratricopeptide repeat-containing protein [Cardiosporidium cionae]|eukprot:KAF8821652.1 tetratricopeptide repeat-containing protein [Cardiosporidium cionae]
MTLCDILPCSPSLIPSYNKCVLKNELLDITHPAAFQLLIRSKVYFDSSQYSRAADVMNDISDERISKALNLSPLAVFLHCYSTLLAERLTDEEHVLVDKTPPSITKKKSVFSFIEKNILESGCLLDSPLLWLLGIAEKEQQHFEKARNYFIKAIQSNPFNWSAWQDLLQDFAMDRWYTSQTTRLEQMGEEVIEYNDLLADVSGMASLDGSSFENFVKFLNLTDHWTGRFGYCLYCMKSNRYRQAIHNYQILLKNLWTCPHIIAQLAKCGFEIRCYELSLQMFHKLREIDRFRFDYVEDLACIYMLRDQLDHLGDLAKLCQETNRFSSSTYCVIGNYLSAQGIHKQAVNSFLKATKQNRNDISAWILVGHEYSQMEEFSKALDAYRRATEIDSSDARCIFFIIKFLFL